MGERQPIVVAGAGIGGLTAALALARAGFAVVVCETTSVLAAIGAGIQLSPNAGRVLQRLGLDDAVAAVASEPPAIDIGDGLTGAKLLSIPTRLFRARYGFPYRVIHRADLQKVLATAVRREPQITLRLDTPVFDAAGRDGNLVIRAGNRTPRDTLTASALICADGVWSRFRKAVGNTRAAQPTGRSAWRATVSAADAPAILQRNAVGLWLGSHGHIVHYRVSEGRDVNIVAIVDDPWSHQGWSAPGDRRVLIARFGAWSNAVRSIINHPHSWQRWAIGDVDPDAPWTKGAIALLGDAAHAMVPFLAQGAAMAIEDAAVLANSLAATADDIPGALKAYEAARKPRVARIWRAARRTGRQYHLGGAAARARNAALRLLGPRLVLMRNDGIYGWKADD